MTDINVGQLSEAINEKMDRDGSNIASPKLPIFLVDVQYPTADNNYTWYRLYSDGWVEQGGEFTLTISAGNGNININLPVLMANGRYTALVNGGFISNVAFLKWNIVSRNTSYFNVSGDTGNSTSSGTTNTCCWQVSGIAAS